MIKNFFKILFRNLWRYKSYTLINIVGMAIGIASLVWGYQTYRYSFSFDNFHKDQNNVYRLLTLKKDTEGLRGIVPMPTVAMSQNDFSGIKETARWDGRNVSVKYEKSDAFSEQVNFTDQAFFDLFNFPVIDGNDNIDNRNAVLLTEKTAKKYFGNENAIGKVLNFYVGESYAKPLTVTGVLKDVPTNSTLQFDFITHFDNYIKTDGSKIATDDWSWFLETAFFHIPNPDHVNRLEKEMNRYIPIQNKAREDWQVTNFKFITLHENAIIRDQIASNYLWSRPDDSAAFGPLFLAILIFISACLNFSNTTIARANRRLKEIGMRKVMGSSHSQLILQLLFESMIIVIAATLLSILFNKWWLPVFNAMFDGVTVSADYLHDPTLLLFIGCLLLGATLLAGTYPAFYISRFNPSIIFRGTVKFGGTNLFSRLMLGLQLSIAIITVIAGIAFSNNAKFQRDYDFGYSMENTVGVILNDTTSYTSLKNEMAKIPEIKSMAGARNHIAFGYRNVVAESEGQKRETNLLEVGHDYVNTMELKLVAGRDFERERESDFSNALLITQNLASLYGWNEQQALGKRIFIDSTSFSVVGIMKNFHQGYLFNMTEPVAFKLGKENNFRFLVIQAKQNELSNVYSKANEAWTRLFPLKPFNGFYQNQITAEAHKVSKSIAIIFKWFALVSILLTATGLFALVSLTTLKKMKEIALRKVVGASPRHILILINKNYFWIFIVSSFIGCYGGWALTNLLLDMIFKINSGVSTGALIGSIAALLIITSIITSIKVWQAIRTNPAKLLSSE